MPVHRLDLSYDGSEFRGYAKQRGQRTVQGELERALSLVLGVEVNTVVAGRTDAGVHARGQVASFEFDGDVAESFRRSVNSILGGEVVVRDWSLAPEGFHARFSAVGRTYRYRASRATELDPLVRGFVWHFPKPVDIDLMRATSDQFLGEVDFTSFCRSKTGLSNVRRVDRAEWVEGEEESLDFWVSANAFCHQMVRSLVGWCFDVGSGRTALEDVSRVIAAMERSSRATLAPSKGLTLWEVSY